MWNIWNFYLGKSVLAYLTTFLSLLKWKSFLWTKKEFKILKTLESYVFLRLFVVGHANTSSGDLRPFSILQKRICSNYNLSHAKNALEFKILKSHNHFIYFFGIFVVCHVNTSLGDLRVSLCGIGSEQLQLDSFDRREQTNSFYPQPKNALHS